MNEPSVRTLRRGGTARRWTFRLLRLPPRAAYALGLGPVLGRWVLLLTTVGRRTGRRRITPLQYERVDGRILVASARGVHADWYANLVADPRVEVRVGRERFAGHATTTTDADAIARFLELRLARHPRMVGRILRSDGVPRPPTREDLTAYAGHLALVAITPPADEPCSPSGGDETGIVARARPRRGG